MNKIIEQLETYYFDDVNLEYFFKSKRHQYHEDLKNYMFNNLNGCIEEYRIYNKHDYYSHVGHGSFLSFSHSILNLLEDDDWKKLYSNLAKRHAIGTCES